MPISFQKFISAILISLSLVFASLGHVACAVLDDSKTAITKQTVGAAYNTAALLLTSIDQVTTIYVDSLGHPTAEQLAAVQEVVNTLKFSRDKLDEVQKLIEEPPAAEEHLILAVDALAEAVDLMVKHRIPIPDAVLNVLDTLQVT
jgi:hypothetical protein